MPVLLEDLRTALGYRDDNHDDDSDLQDVLDQAVEVVEGEVGSLTPAEVTEDVVAGWDGIGLLRNYPVASVEEFTLLPGGRVSGLSYGTTSVTYTHGGMTAAQQGAVILVAKDIWETRRGQGVQRDDDGNLIVGPLLTRRVRELLAPTRRGPSIA